MSAELPDWALAAVQSIGLTAPDPSDDLHRRLVNAVLRLGAGAPDGVRLTAMRWEMNWAQKEAAEVFAKAKVDYEHTVAKSVVRSQAEASARGERMAVSLSNQIAETEAYEHKLAFLLAEKREQSLRKMLDTIETQVDVWRTGRADERAADRAHASGYSGGA